MSRPSNINRMGVTNKGFITGPPMQDKTDSTLMKVRSGARIHKVSKGLNQQIVPLVPTEN